MQTFSPTTLVWLPVRYAHGKVVGALTGVTIMGKSNILDQVALD